MLFKVPCCCKCLNGLEKLKRYCLVQIKGHEDQSAVKLLDSCFVQHGALWKMTRGNECLEPCTAIFNIHSNGALQTQKGSNQVACWMLQNIVCW